MLRFIEQFSSTPIQSLRSSRQVGTITDPIIDPHDLSIVAFYCEFRSRPEELVLFTSDIREFSNLGVIVDSEDSLMETEGLVRLEEIQNINFQLIDKKVITQNKVKVGKVSDYTVDDKSYRIEKLYIRRTLIKSISSGELIIGRRQIVEVNDKNIVVKDTDIRVGARKTKPLFNPQSSN